MPEHAAALHVWNVIATDGATWQMLRGNGYGYNCKGRYSPELMDHYGGRAAGALDEVSATVKFVGRCGQYIAGHVPRHATTPRRRTSPPHARRRTTPPWPDVDVLVLPTQPMRATALPAADAPMAEYVARALEMIGNTAPFDVTGHPAISVPAESDGCRSG